MNRFLTALVAVFSYALFLAVFAYLVAFVGDFGVDRTINTGRSAPAPLAVLIDLALILLFGLQHSIMARQGFKAWWTRRVPKSIERCVYVVSSCGVLVVLMAGWQPLPGALWSVNEGVGWWLLWGGFWGGLALVLLSTFQIDHFELFGLRQAWAHLRGRIHVPPAFSETLLYRIVRHPLYLGWMMFAWVGPEMSVGRALFAAGMTAYILIAIGYEERDLVRFHGQQYVDYRKRVPMLVPRLKPAVPPAVVKRSRSTR